VCTEGLQCDVTTSECVDPSCPEGCPAGTYCDNGSCVDACEGAVCPSGQICRNGECCYENDPECGTGGDPEPGTDAGIGGDDPTPAPSGCGCSSTGGNPFGLGLLAVLVAWVLSRRRFSP
jgi:uncharacterized protein (TIGR03382 family)